MLTWGRCKTIIENGGAEEGINKLLENYPRLETMWEGIKWVLARKGQALGIETVVDDTEYRLCKFASVVNGVPSIILLYSVTENSIILHGIKADEAESEIEELSSGKIEKLNYKDELV